MTNRILAIERLNFIFRKQKKAESLEKFQEEFGELASQADCGDREDGCVRDMFNAHMHNGKIAEERLAETRSPQGAQEYAIRREKGIKHSRTLMTNPFGGQTTTMTKQKPIHYINSRGRNNYANSQNSQRGLGGSRSRSFTRGTQNTKGQQSRPPIFNMQKQGY